MKLTNEQIDTIAVTTESSHHMLTPTKELMRYFARAIEGAVLAAHPPAAPITSNSTELAAHPPAQDSQTFKCAMCAIGAPAQDKSMTAHEEFGMQSALDKWNAGAAPAKDSQKLRAALEAIILDWDGDSELADFVGTIDQARAALAAAPTEQAAVPLQIDAGKILNSPSPALIRRAGYIEGLEAAAKVCEASLLYGQDNAMKPNWNAALEWAAEDIRALIDKTEGKNGT